MPRKSTRGKKSSNDRVQTLVKRQYGTEEADVVMNDLMYVLRSSEVRVPRPGKYYVFIYYAQKPNLLTDRYPVVAVTGVFEWGFNGINKHIDQPRRYNFNSVAGGLYELRTTEIDSVLALPLMDLKQNR